MDNKKKVVKIAQVQNINIADFCKEIMLIYGANVNLARALPDTRDCLKPVERRLLYTMFKDEKMKPNTKNKKVAKIIGDCMGCYYPHGDAALLGVLVGMAQWWKNNACAVGGAGNYGTIAGEDNSQMRYLEAFMPEFTWDCFFSEWEDAIIDFRPNYSGDIDEPEALMCKYPYALFNGVTGLGYGLYGGIPPFNIGETIDLVIELIKNPNKSQVYLIPDLPTYCDVVDTDFKKICNTGEGPFRIRGRIEINKNGNLVIRSIPFQTNINAIIEQIKELVEKTKIIGLQDIKDYSKNVKTRIHGIDYDLLDMYIELVVKKGANTDQLIDVLYKSTKLESTFTVNLEMVDDYENVHYSLKSFILDWIDARRETKRRLYLYRHSIRNKRLYMLNVILSIIADDKNSAKLEKIMKTSKNKKHIVERLISEFNINDVEADTIAEFKNYQKSKDNIEKFKSEMEEIKEEIDRLDVLINDEDLMDKDIIKELKECKKKYGTPRKSKVIKVKDSDFVEDTNHIIAITKKGMVKKLPENMTEIGELLPGDRVINTITINNRESLLVFDSEGKCYGLSVKEIISTPLKGVGYDVTNYIKTSSKIINISKLPEKLSEDNFIIFITKNGIVKKASMSNYMKTTKGGLKALALKSGKEADKLVDILITEKPNANILLYTANGRAIRFSIKDIPMTLRQSSGVIGIKLQQDDEVIGMSLISNKKKYLALITKKGMGKKVLIDNCSKTTRANEGYVLTSLNDDDKIVGLKNVDKDDAIDIFFNNRVETISTRDLKETTKLAKPIKTVKCKNGEHIITIG